MNYNNFSSLYHQSDKLQLMSVSSLAYEKSLKALGCPFSIVDKLKQHGVSRIKDISNLDQYEFLTKDERSVLKDSYEEFISKHPKSVCVFESKQLLELVITDIQSCIIDYGCDLIFKRINGDKLNQTMMNESKAIAKIFAVSANGLDMQKWLDNIFVKIYQSIIRPWILCKNMVASEEEIDEWLNQCSECKQSNVQIGKLLNVLFDWPTFFLARCLNGIDVDNNHSVFYCENEKCMSQLIDIFKILANFFYKSEQSYEFQYLLRFIESKGLINQVTNTHLFLLRILCFTKSFRIHRSIGSILVKKTFNSEFLVDLRNV